MLVDELVCKSIAFHELLSKGTAVPMNLSRTSYLFHLFSSWFRRSGLQDRPGFCQLLCAWLDYPVLNTSWEIRFLPSAASQAAALHEKGGKKAKINLVILLFSPQTVVHFC